MTGLLEKALQRIELLPLDEQDSIASQILESMEDDALWDAKLGRDADVLERLADEALRQHRNGETQSIDDLLG
jgi:hypothetical protein